MANRWGHKLLNLNAQLTAYRSRLFGQIRTDADSAFLTKTAILNNTSIALQQERDDFFSNTLPVGFIRCFIHLEVSQPQSHLRLCLTSPPPSLIKYSPLISVAGVPASGWHNTATLAEPRNVRLKSHGSKPGELR